MSEAEKNRARKNLALANEAIRDVILKIKEGMDRIHDRAMKKEEYPESAMISLRLAAKALQDLKDRSRDTRDEMRRRQKRIHKKELLARQFEARDPEPEPYIERLAKKPEFEL